MKENPDSGDAFVFVFLFFFYFAISLRQKDRLLSSRIFSYFFHLESTVLVTPPALRCDDRQVSFKFYGRRATFAFPNASECRTSNFDTCAPNRRTPSMPPRVSRSTKCNSAMSDIRAASCVYRLPFLNAKYMDTYMLCL
jgi:hypothetical protein